MAGVEGVPQGREFKQVRACGALAQSQERDFKKTPGPQSDSYTGRAPFTGLSKIAQVTAAIPAGARRRASARLVHHDADVSATPPQGPAPSKFRGGSSLEVAGVEGLEPPTP